MPADTAEARARVRQLEALLEGAERRVSLKVEKAWRDLRDAATRIEAATRQTDLAPAAQGITAVRYQVCQAHRIEASR